jgi:hypothetical protein
MTVSL